MFEIIKVVSFKIASEASYIDIFSGQKFNSQFDEVLKALGSGQTVLPESSILIRQKLVENAKIEKFKCDIFDDFKQCVIGL